MLKDAFLSWQTSVSSCARSKAFFLFFYL